MEIILLSRVFNSLSITFIKLSTYTPQANSFAERLNTTLLNEMRVTLVEVFTDNRFSGEAVLHAAELHNQTATPVLEMRSPVEVLMRHEFDS